MVKLVQFEKRGVDGSGSLELAPGAAKFARGWVIFFVAAAVGLLFSMWARATVSESAAVPAEHAQAPRR
ncbi:MAG TPA: hypothetical protein VJM11_03605 [Nevskiaceae bacterium]|nr:hypothetical protein [Nevskiaceae bacterium]